MTESGANGGGLRYVSDRMPGIRREHSRRGFRYRYATGAPVREKQVLDRIQRLVIPPAWTDVWICPDPNGHLQATGRDARGRKQNRYHAGWQAIREETKYNRMIAFARSLPGIRARLRQDLSLRGLSRGKVLATVVRLLESSLIRIGNEEYARENNSFGLTTLRRRHVQVRGAHLTFHFRGKAGKRHQVNIHDARLARVVRNCQDLPGQELFHYVDGQGHRHKIHSDDVNGYLRRISGKDFTAKDFRTWAGTVLCARALDEAGSCSGNAGDKGNLAQAIKTVARQLGNTPAVCRKCYVHPELIAAYLDGTLAGIFQKDAGKSRGSSGGGLRREEAIVLELLRQRAAGADLTGPSVRALQGERTKQSESVAGSFKRDPQAVHQ